MHRSAMCVPDDATWRTAAGGAAVRHVPDAGSVTDGTLPATGGVADPPHSAEAGWVGAGAAAGPDRRLPAPAITSPA
jgi:hypothetical protein